MATVLRIFPALLNDIQTVGCEIGQLVVAPEGQRISTSRPSRRVEAEMNS